MKRILLPIAVLLTCFEVQAQRYIVGDNIVSSSSSRVVRIVEEKPIIPFETIHYIKGGVNANFIILEGWESEVMEVSQNSPGAHLVYGMDKPFAQKGHACLFWGYEIGGAINSFSPYSYELNEIREFDPWPDGYDISRYGIRLSPKIGFKLGGPKASIGMDVGCYVDYTFHSTYSYWGMDSDNDRYSEYVEMYNPLIDVLVNERWSKLDAGLFIGGGLWIRRSYFGFRYSIGIIDPFLSGNQDSDDIFVIPNDALGEHRYFLPVGYGAQQHNVYFSFAWRL